MLQNYFAIALRNLRRHAGYAALNTGGLALGISCGLVVFLLVRRHSSMDYHHANASRIYRVVTDLHFANLIQTPGVPYPFGNAFRNDFPEIKTVACVSEQHDVLVSVERGTGLPKQKFMLEREVMYAEPAFFDVFDYTWRKGSPSVLNEPNAAVITEKMAAQLFGPGDPVGKTFRVDNKHDVRVTGLLEDIPANTQFRREIFLSYLSLVKEDPEEFRHWNGVGSNHQCFIVLPPGLSPDQVKTRLPAFVKKYQKKPEEWEHHLQPLSDIYFNSAYGGDVPKVILWALAVVGLFLIGTGCINFINMATAQALNRSKEVGVRKVVGSTRRQLFSQFMFETGLITLCALLLALAAVATFLPFLNEQTNTALDLNMLRDPVLGVFLMLLWLGVTLLSGFYPALVLAGFSPVQALKGRLSTAQAGGFSLRRGLVVTQFVICQALIIAALVISAQMSHLRNASLGFNKEAIVMLPLPRPDKSKMEILRSQLLATPGVKAISFSSRPPASQSNNTTNCRFDTRQEDEPWQIATRPADANFVETYGLEIVAGRNLKSSDSIHEYLINETAVRKLGLSSPQEAIGKPLRVYGMPANIAGVVRDFYTRTLNDGYEPLALMTSMEGYRFCGVKIDLANTPATLGVLDRVWNSVFPDDFYSYTFLDEDIAKFYETEHILLRFVQVFCGIAIFIGCLGLYGLVTFMAARKRKEIGVRKVLGATAGQILALFGKEFFRLIAVAFAVAAPLAWWAMAHWLEDYNYRIPMSGAFFAAAAIVTVLIAFLTIGAQSIRAALTHPSESLRNE